MALTLNDVKEALRVDFSDHDSLLTRLLAGEVVRAEKITGLEETDFNKDIENGILKAIESMYANRTDINQADLSTSTITYKRNCISPML